MKRRWSAPGSILVALLVAMAFSPSALGATFTVNQTTDEFDDGTVRDTFCDTDDGAAGLQCTLRAAIQEASDAAVNPGHDTIDFDPAVFTGSAATSTIIATSVQPAINETATINGGDCDLTAAFKPCVGLDAPGTFGLIASGNNVEIRGLAVMSGGTGILVSGDNGKLAGNWFGLGLDETPQANSRGVELTGDMNTVGGETAADRNVFAHNLDDGLRITGGDNNTIKGNYFGTKPDGTTAASSGLSNNRDNIEVSSAGGASNLASGNTIGGTQSAAQLASPECDGPCNVISNSRDGVDLETEGGTEGSFPGPTTIRGNFIGLDRTGQAQAPNENRGIRALMTESVNHLLTVGGPDPGDRNVISGNTQGGLLASDDVTVQNNFFGSNSLGTAAIPNMFSDVFVGATSSVAINSTIRGNRFVGNGLDPAISLRVNFATRIAGNTFGIGTGGESLGLGGDPIRLNGGDNEVGGTVPADANVIGNTPAGTPAIHVFGGDQNDIIGNSLGVTPQGANVANGGPGIRITNNFTDAALGNTVGGDTAAGENVISNSGGDAIEVVDDHATGGAGLNNGGNSILRNRGAGNGSTVNDLFVDLRTDTTGDGVGNPADGPNGGIATPTLDPPTNTSLSGSGAVANATLRVFRTVNARGDVKGFVNSGVDGDGAAWTVAFPSPLPDGQCVSATQTDTGGNSSELPDALAIDAAVCDVTAPIASIDDGPSGVTGDQTPTFTFSSNEPGSTFECSVDSAPFGACSGPGASHTTASLTDGPHSIEVRATDPVGNVGTPASRAFTVDTTPAPTPAPPDEGGDAIAPNTTITAGPKDKTKKKTATFEFSGTDARAVAGFQCSLDGGAFAPCSSGQSFKVKKGTHTLEVRATDAAGNVDPTPASDTWKVRKKKKRK